MQPDAETAWRACQRGDWMLWLCGRLSGKPWSECRRKLVLAACACARLALVYVPAGEQRPLRAIELAEMWARGGRVTRQAILDAACAAYAADAAAADAYAAYARNQILAQCADIVRTHYPTAPVPGVMQ